MADVRLTAEAQEQFAALPRTMQTRVTRLLERLENWPAVSGAKPLRGDLAGYFRLRTGDYRLQLHVAGETVLVEKIGHRDDFYEDGLMPPPNITLNGTKYVVLELAEYERLTTLAKAADLPPLPEPDEDGNVPAVPFARATIARNLIRDRVAAGLTQRQLAKLAGVPVETLCRIETGQRTPSVPTIDKIDQALRKALTKRKVP